jgi:hypothetical protein
MSAIVWDEVGSRTYESGLDRGVIYLSDGSAIPWNGLVDVDEDVNANSSSVFYDGRQISELVTLGAYKGKIKAISYPEVVSELEGMGMITPGMLLSQQRPKVFALSYRTLVGNDLDGDAGYKIHVLYNVTMVSGGKSWTTITDDSEMVEFQWDISACADEVDGFAPTSSIALDSRLIDPALMEDIETRLWGSESTDPDLIPLADFVNYLYFEYKWKVVDNGDGTFTAITPDDLLLEADGVEANKWTLHEANANLIAPNVWTLKDSFA